MSKKIISFFNFSLKMAPVSLWHLLAYGTRSPRVRVGIEFGLGSGLGLGLGLRIEKEYPLDFECRVI